MIFVQIQLQKYIALHFDVFNSVSMCMSVGYRLFADLNNNFYIYFFPFIIFYLFDAVFNFDLIRSVNQYGDKHACD